MKIVVLGALGQVGWQLQRALAPLGEVVALHRGVTGGDLMQPAALAATLTGLRPDAIVNAAAYTAVDKAESEPDLAFAINATACGVLARTAAELGAWLVHYSTDYVFPGDGDTPWRESDATGPLNAYGASKLAGEQAIQVEDVRHLIFRTSWVYESWGQNFLKSMLRLASQRDSLAIVADQFGAPTRAALIADVTAHALRQAHSAGTQGASLSGVYHLAASGCTQWQAYAQCVVQAAQERGWPMQARPEHIRPIRTDEYPVAAPRPANSRLDTSKLQATFGLSLPPWQDGVRAVVAELSAARHTVTS